MNETGATTDAIAARNYRTTCILMICNPVRLSNEMYTDRTPWDLEGRN